MKSKTRHIDFKKRRTLRQLAGLSVLPILPPANAKTNARPTLRSIPSTGQPLPAIGMGSWLTFDINPRGSELANRIEILKTFFTMGGQVIDSSPMYGHSEAVIGECLEALAFPEQCFRATKVWTSGQAAGIQQMQQSAQLWKTKQFNLMQIHNLLDWKTQIKTLMDWKERGQLDYIGVTTYGGLRHRDIENIMRNHPIDFVQLTYNILDREAEKTLLPLAQEQGIAVIANRPFREGRLFDYIKNKKLPRWADAFHCQNWAQYFLKFILAHPAVTCAIPATSQATHMEENMGALVGPLPDRKQQEQMAVYFRSI